MRLPVATQVQIVLCSLARPRLQIPPAMPRKRGQRGGLQTKVSAATLAHAPFLHIEKAKKHVVAKLLWAWHEGTVLTTKHAGYNEDGRYGAEVRSGTRGAPCRGDFHLFGLAAVYGACPVCGKPTRLRPRERKAAVIE